MGFKDEFKAGWKGHAGTTPSEALLLALSKNEGFKQRSSLKSVLGLATSAVEIDDEILWACSGSKKEGKVTFFAILLVMQDRVLLAQHSYLESIPKYEISEIPFNKISNIRIRKDKALLAEIIIETSGANLVMNSNANWLEKAKAVLLEKIDSTKSSTVPDIKESKSLSTELMQLAQLLNDGILTQEEFDRAKTRIIVGNEAANEPQSNLNDSISENESEIDLDKDNFIEVLPSANDEFLPPSPANKVSGSFFKRKKVVVWLCIALLAIAIPVNSNFQEGKRAAAETKLAELEAQTINDAFTADALRTNFPDCTSIQDIITASVFPEFDALALKTKKISDAREALSFVSSNSVVATGLMAKYESALDEKLLVGLEDVYSNSDRDELASETQLTAWKGQWKEAVLTSCNLLAENTSVETSLQKLDSEFKRITVLAGSVPWYPEGFTEYQNGIAIKWVDRGPDPCFSACTYATLDLIAEAGCPTGLYVEVTFTRDGTAFDWSNDTLPQLNPGQKGRLQFVSYESSGSSRVQISQVSCT